jgi:hypothetical protein
MAAGPILVPLATISTAVAGDTSSISCLTGTPLLMETFSAINATSGRSLSASSNAPESVFVVSTFAVMPALIAVAAESSVSLLRSNTSTFVFLPNLFLFSVSDDRQVPGPSHEHRDNELP